MSCLRYLCLFVYSGVQHIQCCFFPLVYPMVPVSLDCSCIVFSLLCTLWCQFLWIVNFLLRTRGSLNIYFGHLCFQLAMHQFSGISAACPFTLCRGFFTPKIGPVPPKLQGLSICRGTKLRKKQQLYPQFQNSVGTCLCCQVVQIVDF